MQNCAYSALAPRTVGSRGSWSEIMIALAVIGLYIFTERDALDRQEQRYFTVGHAGGLSVALSFSGVL
jgi:hypothetical protein